MLDSSLIALLPKLEPPILTVYLDTNPAKPSNQGMSSGARIWLKSEGKVLQARLPRPEQKEVRKQLERVDSFLKTRAKRERGLAVFAGPKAWRVLRLQVDVENELHWGQPSLTQLLWLLDEHQPYGVVVVDRSGARFFRFWMGEVEEQKAQRFFVDTSHWRVKNVVRPGGRSATAQRDAFEQRVAAQYARLFRDAAKRIAQWTEQEDLNALFIAGSQDAVESVWTHIPDKTRAHSTRLTGDYARLSAAALQEHVTPEIQRWKRREEAALVNNVIEERKLAVLGIDQTLAAMQEGRARAVLVARGLRGGARQCRQCGWTDRAADPVCPACGGERGLVSLREVFPQLVRRASVPVDVVAGRAAAKLRTVGGMAAWLRE